MTPAATLSIVLPALLLAAPAGAVASTSAVPAVTVTVSDGVEQAAAGDTLRYVIVVENTGGTEFSGSVSLRAPDFVEVAASGATLEDGAARWAVEVPAGESARLSAEATVGGDHGGAYQVVTLAELADAGGSTVVRAADADAIPGMQAPPAVPGLTGQPAGIPHWLLPAGIAAAVLVGGSSLALFGVLLARRTRAGMG